MSAPASDASASTTGAEHRAQHKYSCPACGGEAHWHPGRQALVCAYCGTESPHERLSAGTIVEHDLATALRAVPATARGLSGNRRQVRCQHCHAISFFSAEHQGRRCDFCGSTALVPFDEGVDVVQPQSLLPFRVSEPEARNRVRQWYGSRWWAPNALSRRALTDTLHGVYLPYWTFDAQASASYTVDAGTYYKDNQNRQQVRWQRVSGQVTQAFDDTLVCGSRGVHPTLMRAIEPFPTSAGLVPYDAAYLSGWTVERYALGLAGAAQQGQQRMLQVLEQRCVQAVRADTQRNLRMDARFDRQTFKHVLLPVWLVSYRYGARDYQVVINGHTGQVAGEYPKSWVKIALAVLLGLLVLGVLAALEAG